MQSVKGETLPNVQHLPICSAPCRKQRFNVNRKKIQLNYELAENERKWLFVADCSKHNIVTYARIDNNFTHQTGENYDFIHFVMAALALTAFAD